MRITIGGKIAGIAGALLGLMILTAVLSVWKVRQVAAEIDSNAEYFLPLSENVADIDVHVLEQELILQRLLYGTESSQARQQSQTADLQLFADRGQLIDQEFADLHVLVARGLEVTTDDADHLELSVLVPELRNLEKQHQDFHDLALRIVELRAAGRGEVAAELRTVLDREEEDFDVARGRLRQRLHDYAESSADEAADHENHVELFNLLVTTIAVLLGALFTIAVSRGLLRTIKTLRGGLELVEEGQLAEIPVASKDEIGDLTRSFNHMVGELRVKEKIKDTFGKYLDPRVVEGLIGGADGARLAVEEGEKQVVTVFFSDIVGFTQLGERMTPGALVRLINEYFELATEPIIEHSGIVDKYIGDAIMAFWGPPFIAAGESAKLACFAALDQRLQLQKFRDHLPNLLGMRRGQPKFDVRMGLATGEVLMGSIGSRAQQSYTVMGDTVNLGSRLEGANKAFGTGTLVCERTRRLAASEIEFREIDAITVVGRNEPVQVFELLGRTGELTPTVAQVRNAYEAGLQAYRQRDWQVAVDAFQECLAVGDDPPAAVFLERIDHLRRAAPPEDWDGVWRLQSK